MFEFVEEAQTDRIEELERFISEARRAYEQGSPIVEDEVYDAWVDELKQLRADSPEVKAIGATPVSEWAKVSHGVSMGSLDKVNLPEELLRWVEGTGVPVLDAMRFPWLFWTEKLDGISIHLRYEDGKFVQAITRGDGVTGEDITPNVRKMRGVVTEVPGFSGSVRGEVVLYKSALVEHFPGYANTRNTASGVAKRYDGKGSEHLTVMVYMVMDSDMMEATVHNHGEEHAQFEWLKAQGFIVPSFGVASSVAEINQVWVDYQESVRDSLDYDIDGLVVRVNRMDLQLGLGEKDGRPLGAVAYKFAPITRVTVIRRIDWQVGGSGRVTPVAVFDPVNILGATITNASVYNLTYIRKLGINVGATGLVARANDVIPRVVKVLENPSGKPAEAPSECPVCGFRMTMEGEHLVCPNTAGCPAQAVGRVERYIKALGIKEWGSVLIEKLVASGKATSVPALYKLTAQDLMELDRISEHMANKLLGILWEKNPIPMEQLVGALSIPGCASSTIRLVMDAGFDTWDKFRKLTPADFSKIPGLGPVKSQTLSDWIRESGWTVDTLLSNGVKIKDIVHGSLTGQSVCFTGTMTRKRGDLEALVVAAGGVVKSSVGRGLTYLVMSDPNSTSSKAVAARKNGTKCISEQEFLSLVE